MLKPIKITNLPDDLLLEIFKRVPKFPDHFQCSQVCTRWKALSRSSRLWTKFIIPSSINLTSSQIIAILHSIDLKRLQKLDLSMSIIDDELYHVIQKFESTLRVLNLSNCVRVTDTSVRHFMRCPRIRQLHLGSCRNVSRKCVRSMVCRFPDLEILDLSSTFIVRDSVLYDLGTYAMNLRELHLRHSFSISEEGISFVLQKCLNMEVLTLFNCHDITRVTSGMNQSKSFPLREIDLSWTNIKHIGIQELTCNFKNISKLRLTGCGYVTDQCLDLVADEYREGLLELEAEACVRVNQGDMYQSTKHVPRRVGGMYKYP